jgi:hypothetical protein
MDDQVKVNRPTFGNLDDWHTDDALSTDGAPLDLNNGRTILCRRAGTRNRAFMVAVAELDTDDEVARYDVYARHVVAGWSGINDAEGNPIPYTAEACVALFQYAPEVFDLVLMFAAQRANYRGQKLAEDGDAVK